MAKWSSEPDWMAEDPERTLGLGGSSFDSTWSMRFGENRANAFKMYNQNPMLALRDNSNSLFQFRQASPSSRIGSSVDHVGHFHRTS